MSPKKSETTTPKSPTKKSPSKKSPTTTDKPKKRSAPDNAWTRHLKAYREDDAEKAKVEGRSTKTLCECMKGAKLTYNKPS